jgi:NitT/TauT family transport system substrate-binding protein
MEMRKYLWPLCILILLFSSCGSSPEEVKRQTRAERARLKTEDSLALKVAVLPTLDCLPIYIGVEQGLFKERGVDVHLRKWNAQMDCDTAMIGGSIEGTVTDLIRGERMKRKGVALRYVAATNTYWQMIANRTTRVNSVSQLGDKMIAMTRYSATDYLTDYYMKGAKTSAAFFKIQINDVKLRLQMLQNNAMDAMWLPEPQATAARQLKNVVLKDSQKDDIRLGVIAFREKAMNDARIHKQVDNFITVYNMACDSINKNGLQHYSELISKYCGVDEETVSALPKLHFPHAQPPRGVDLERARQ